MREYFQSQLDSPINQTKENPRVFYLLDGRPANCLLSEVDSLSNLTFIDYWSMSSIDLPRFEQRKKKKPSK